VLHHAAKKPVYSLWLTQELARHGYQLCSGTLYPMLYSMPDKGYLRSVEECKRCASSFSVQVLRS
jgi:DNA-binding PadR family transcriptional regulator